MNERAVRARTNPNANIIIIRRQSGRSLTLDNAYCNARSTGGEGCAAVMRQCAVLPEI